MSAEADQADAGDGPRPVVMGRVRLNPAQVRHVIGLTVAALVLFVAVRLLPTSGSLNHMDFRMTGRGALEFCDPANPQFIPVVAVRSPVVMALKSDAEPQLGRPVTFTLTLTTATGKPIAPEDLLVAHTRKLHLLVVDPTLVDYQHIHPEPGRRPGEWVFTLAPERAGLYRVFADFTPAATGRGLYASADFLVPGAVGRISRSPNTTAQAFGCNFELVIPAVFQAGKVADLAFRIESQGTIKEPVPLQPVMGAFAHLVAFDESRVGFAHLHPAETDLSKQLDALHPELHFKLTIPSAGRYVIWAQVNLGGNVAFVPFWIDVLP